MSDISDSPINKTHLMEGDTLNLLSVSSKLIPGDDSKVVGSLVQAVKLGGTLAGITGSALIAPEEIKAVASWGQLSPSEKWLAGASLGTSIGFLGSLKGTSSSIEVDPVAFKEAKNLTDAAKTAGRTTNDYEKLLDKASTAYEKQSSALYRKRFAAAVVLPSFAVAEQASLNMDQNTDSPYGQ